LEQIRDLDAGSWFGEEFAGEPVPTLDQALEAVKGKADLCIEIKQASPAAVIQTVRKHGVVDNVIIFDFNHGRLREAKRLEPGVRTLALGVTGRDLGSLDPELVFAVGPTHGIVDEIFVERAHDMGFVVYTYTVNDEKRMRELVSAGVDGIITDRPVLGLEVLNEFG
jgi:glycerophosphoryl diester phosphodiesterase